jgi:hypothetical protein
MSCEGLRLIKKNLVGGRKDIVKMPRLILLAAINRIGYNSYYFLSFMEDKSLLHLLTIIKYLSLFYFKRFFVAIIYFSDIFKLI